MIKVGDRVKILSGSRSGSRSSGYKDGDIVDVLCVQGDYIFISTNGDGARCNCGKHNWVIESYQYTLVEESIISNKKELNMKEKFITMFLSEPEKSFKKAGITNGDGMLTSDGQSIFLSYLLKEKGNDFKTAVVDELLKEVKE